jgi:aspartate kinase
MLRAAMMIVQKFGGTSVGSIARIKRVAKRVVATQKKGHQVAVVVSAMSGETNRLLGLTKKIHEDPNDREVDVVIATGEQVTVGLLALAIRRLGGQAQSFLGHQVRISTESMHGRARIQSIDCQPVIDAMKDGKVAVIAGFQGVDERGAITTLGRGGSDTTGVAIAAALNTDVDGVYTTDPNVCPTARKIERISYEEMLELASVGAKVLQIRSVELGMKYAVPIHVRSSFNKNEGTWVVPEEKSMENVVVSGVTASRDEAKVTLFGVPDKPGVAARIFSPLSEHAIVVDMIVQNVSADGRTDLTFTVPKGDFKRAVDLIKTRCGDLCGGGERISTSEGLAKISVVGVGMRSHAGVAQRMFELLSKEGINILMISTSEIKISVVVEGKYAELAVRVLHDGFGLDKPPGERVNVA